MPDDFWASDLADDQAEPTPYKILRDQAMALARKTKDVVRAEVKTEQNGERIEHELLLFAPVLGLRVSVLRVAREGGGAYPVTLSGRYVKSLIIAKKEPEFSSHLKKILGSKEVTQAIQTLSVDSIASGLQFFLVEDGEVVGEAGSLNAAKDLARRMMGQDAWIDIHQLGKERVGYYVWPEGQPEPVYHEATSATDAGALLIALLDVRFWPPWCADWIQLSHFRLAT